MSDFAWTGSLSTGVFQMLSAGKMGQLPRCGEDWAAEKTVRRRDKDARRIGVFTFEDSF
jgi:hypothetical protein